MGAFSIFDRTLESSQPHPTRADLDCSAFVEIEDFWII
jgi:hypothetical protein